LFRLKTLLQRGDESIGSERKEGLSILLLRRGTGLLLEDLVSFSDVLLELSRVVDEVNETLEIIGVHGKKHTSDLSVEVGILGSKHGVEEVVSDGSLSLSGGHGGKLGLGGKSKGRTGSGNGGGSNRGSSNGDVSDLSVLGEVGRGLSATSPRSGSVVSGTRSTSASLSHGTSSLVVVGHLRREEHGVLLHGLLSRDTGTTDILGLEESYEQGLGEAGNSVGGGISDGLLGGLGGLEADESESTRGSVGIKSDGGRGDSSEL